MKQYSQTGILCLLCLLFWSHLQQQGWVPLVLCSFSEQLLTFPTVAQWYLKRRWRDQACKLITCFEVLQTLEAPFASNVWAAVSPRPVPPPVTNKGVYQGMTLSSIFIFTRKQIYSPTTIQFFTSNRFWAFRDSTSYVVDMAGNRWARMLSARKESPVVPAVMWTHSEKGPGLFTFSQLVIRKQR